MTQMKLIILLDRGWAKFYYKLTNMSAEKLGKFYYRHFGNVLWVS